MEVLDKVVRDAALMPRKQPASTLLKVMQSAIVNILKTDWKDAEDKDIFAENFFLDHSVDLLKKESSALFLKAGKIISVDEVIPKNQLHGLFIIDCERSNLEVSFGLTPENPPLIQHYQIKEIAKEG
jgi:hypothetical protein